MRLKWDDRLATGSEAIDGQHRELFLRVNALLNAFEMRTREREEIKKIVGYLSDYVVYHFSTEERYMENYRYASKSAHTAQHEQFVRSFMKIRDRLLQEEIQQALAEDARQLVVDWLLNHITYSDRALGMYLKMKM